IQNDGGGWSAGARSKSDGGREVDPEVGGNAGFAGDDEEGRSAASRADPWLLGKKETWRLLHQHHDLSDDALPLHDQKIASEMFQHHTPC
ncbi:hypothetical protein ZWY2020_038419, partial [Hordeum vulgare]